MTDPSDRRDRVVLVDEYDREVGTAEKLDAHRRGLLHRAFSVFVFDPAGRWLLQRRALGKYHSAGLWSNACCSHPRPGEPVEEAALRRLEEEMGFTCPIRERFTFRYRVRLADRLWEHELDHVLTGTYEGDPWPAPDEVEEWAWVSQADLSESIDRDPERFTYWFRAVAPRLMERPA